MSNTRGRARRGVNMPDYGVSNIAPGQMPPGANPSAPVAQSLANGNAGQPQQPHIYAVPNVDAHLQPYQNRALRSNFTNPSMQFAQGEAHLERNQQQSSLTIHNNRFQPGAQPPQNFVQPAQIGPSFTQAPPNAFVYPQFQVNIPYQYYSSGVMPDISGLRYMMCPSAQPPEYPQRLNLYAPQVMMPAAPAVIPQAPHPQVPKQKKILPIIDPQTKEVRNRENILKQQQQEQRSSSQETMTAEDGLRRSAHQMPEQRREPATVPSFTSQKFTMQVAQSVLGEAAMSKPPAATVASSVPPEFRERMTSPPSERPTVSAPPQSTTVHQVERSAPPEISETVVNNITGKKDEKLEDATVPQDTNPEEVMSGDSEKTEEKDTVTSDAETKAAITESEVTTVTEVQDIAQSDDGSISVQENVVTTKIFEEEENEKPPTEGENEEAQRAEKEEQLRKEQLEMLQDKVLVDVEKCFYGRHYLLLLRNILKETKQLSCPEKEPELKELGIDIASAPAAGSIGVGQRRYDNPSAGSSRFAPNWFDKTQKPKMYHGRHSDRPILNQRNDRDRKRSAIARPSLERANREPVTLHKSANAWKPEHDVSEEQKMYKNVRNLLNKLTPSNYKELSQKFIELNLPKYSERMGPVINIIFEKAVEEPNFCSLYSDLCKLQVDKELKRKSEFRSGLLNRCQQTFENKNKYLIELQKKRQLIEGETDPQKRKEMEADAQAYEFKERRRMFGNIAFIGQLYRHDLIVPKILNWCIIHLLKNHSESPCGDEESIECAVRMLEAVGKIAEKHGQSENEVNMHVYFEHLENISKNVAPRVRFLILNLFELRENNWNPRKSVEQGPKTIEQVHDEAKKEEMQNKLQREQYNRKRYEGRTSLDRRNPRAPLLARPSQDGRPHAMMKVGDMGRDQKMRTVGGANLAPSTTKRIQSLHSLDQGHSLGARRPPFSSGAIGGGQQAERSMQARGSLSMRGAGRGSFASRENSQPSSREPSESRKHSREEERNSDLAAARAITDSGSNSMLRRGYAGVAAGGSSVSLSAADDEKREAVEIGGDVDNETPSDSRQAELSDRELFGGLVDELLEYFNDLVDIEQIFSSVMDFSSDKQTGNIDQAKVHGIFFLLMKVGIEKVTGDVKRTERRCVGQVICRCLQRDDVKATALRGIADYCQYVVDHELWEDNMKIWETVAEVITWSIMCDMQHFGGARPSLGDFRESFRNADEDGRRPHALLVHVLKRIVEVDIERDEHVTSAPMAFDEIRDLHVTSLLEQLKRTVLSSGESLYHLLLN